MPATPSRPRTPVHRRLRGAGTATAITGLLAAPLLLLHTAGPAAAADTPPAAPAPAVAAATPADPPGDAAATLPTPSATAPSAAAPGRTAPVPAPLPTLRIPGATATPGPSPAATTPAPTGGPRRTTPRRTAPAAPAPAAPAPAAPRRSDMSTRAADRQAQPAAVRRFDDRETGTTATGTTATGTTATGTTAAGGAAAGGTAAGGTAAGGTAAAAPAPGAAAVPTPGQPGGQPSPSSSGLSLHVSGSGDNPLDSPVSLVLLLGAITFIPALLIMTTAFTRVVIVLGFVRSALGTNGIPPNQVVIGLSLFLSLFVMAPTFSQANRDALQPLTKGQISQTVALQRAVVPFREFMLKQVRDEDLSMFVKLAGDERPAKPADVPTTTLVPAFLLSELRTAFLIGFVIFIPFIIIDLVVSAALSAMGMVMLPPALISLPFKLLLFVAANGWALVVDSLVSSFHH